MVMIVLRLEMLFIIGIARNGMLGLTEGIKGMEAENRYQR